MLNPVHLVLGEDEFLAERATKAIIAQLSPAAERTTLRAGDVTEGELAMATSPSLFAEERIVLIKNTELAGKEPLEILLRACVDPAPGMTLIIEHSGGGRQKAYVKKFEKIAEVHRANPLRDRDRRNPPLSLEEAEQRLGSLRTSFVRGLSTNLANPKIVLALSAMIAPLLPASPSWATQIVVILSLWASSFILFGVLTQVVSTNRVRRKLLAAGPVIDMGSGGFFCVVGALLVVRGLLSAG